MNITIDNIEQFKIFFDVVSDSSSELLELQLFIDHMVCSVLDKSHTRFFHVEFEEDFFDLYNVEETTSITVFMDDLRKLLKSCNRKDTLYLEVNDPYLVAKVESDNGNRRIFEFVLPSDFVESPTLPHIDLDMVCSFEVGDMKQSSKDIDLIGSKSFKIIADGECLNFTAGEEVSTKYMNTIDADYEQKSENTISASFNLDYISQILKFDKINKEVKLKLGENLPLIYSFKDKLMGVTVSGMIAPLISEEE